MKINGYIDHSILKPTTQIKEIENLCHEAIEYQFAAVCILPPFVKEAKRLLEGSNVKTATVISFPFGYAAVTVKIVEILAAISDGADELDIVINIIALKNNDWLYLANEINNIMTIIEENHKVVKIIIESGILTEDEIKKCCELYGASGVNYLKTSTGFAEKGATIEAVELMRTNLPSHVQIKASGGIRTYGFAQELINAGAARLGCGSSLKLIREQDEIMKKEQRIN